jgi:hypothetical protein
MKDVEVGGTCGTHGGWEKCYRILVGKPEVKGHWEDLCIGERITFS